MFLRSLSRGFGSFNILNSVRALKNAALTPVKHLKAIIEPTHNRESKYINITTDAFDEVASEWQNVVANDVYDMQIFNGTDASQLTNFGTVDNPNIVFSADTPFRFVGCSGPVNEDDYEGHDVSWFMLREGSMQRCLYCGQVFKLVRLRQDQPVENLYYASGFLPYDSHDLAEPDMYSYIDITKMNAYDQPSNIEDPSDRVASLVNSDDHDRILIDPAYRLAFLKQTEQKGLVLAHHLRNAQARRLKASPPPPLPISKELYQTLIEVEHTIKQLDRQANKVYKFHSRKFIDPENHARREQRMKERASARWDSAFTLFEGRLTEEEQKFRDYFQTELERNPLDEEIEQAKDLRQILASPEFNFSNIDLQQPNSIQDTNIGYLQKILFNFKFRQARNQDHAKREAHMIAEQAKRMADPKVQQLLGSAADSKNKQAYLEFVAEQGLRLVKDYYAKQNLQYLDVLPKDLKATFAEVYQNLTVVKKDSSSYKTYGLPKWDKELGVFANIKLMGKSEMRQVGGSQVPKQRLLSQEDIKKIEEGKFDDIK